LPVNEEQYAEVKAALASNDTEHGSFRRRLNEHEAKIEKLQETQVQLANLTNAVNNLASGIGEVKTAVQGVDKRVAELEREPADKWKKVTWEIIKAVVMAAVGAAIAVFVKGA
jgi:chromosome segregation ATPase